MVRLFWGSFSPHEDPPQNQSIRVRFYDSRPDDSELPNAVLYEEIFFNPPRTPTGRTISIPSAPAEQEFEAVLSKPFELKAAQRYWLEIVQLGDINSHYRWEFSPGNQTPFAFMNPNVSDWNTFNGNVAFQLSEIPEPTTLLLLIGAAGLALTRPKART